MLLSKTAIVKWNKKNKKYYEEKGYPFTNYGDEFKVKVEDLTFGSRALVDIKCDCENCENPYLKPMRFQNYNKYVHENGKYYWKKCATKLFGVEKSKITRFENSISFYNWCYENLSKEEADIIMLRWDYDLNIDINGNILNPKEISYGSRGFNNKGYWFKCLEHHEHGSELKAINSFTSGQKGSLNCSKCTVIISTHPQLVKYFLNIEDAYKYSHGSGEYIPMKCPDCGYEKKMGICTLISQGFSCSRCSDGKSFPELLVFNILEQLLNDNFQTQLSKTTFNWCSKYKYDFYIPIFNCIIETHGLQHYECGFERIKSSKKHVKTLKEIQENDKIKEKLAKDNGIINYIVLDCRYSKLEWIKNSILHSKLNDLFDLSLIDWNKCYEYTCNSLVKVACDLWNNGIKNTKEIGKILKLNKGTIVIYLKQGALLGWCDYDPKIASLNKAYKSKKVICLTTNEIFNSIVVASKNYNLQYQNISKCCRGKLKSAGKLEDGTKLKWMYYDEYLKTI